MDRLSDDQVDVGDPDHTKAVSTVSDGQRATAPAGKTAANVSVGRHIIMASTGTVSE